MLRTGKPLTAPSRGRMLAATGIRAKTPDFDGRDAKGYELATFWRAWNALL